MSVPEYASTMLSSYVTSSRFSKIAKSVSFGDMSRNTSPGDCSIGAGRRRSNVADRTSCSSPGAIEGAFDWQVFIRTGQIDHRLEKAIRHESKQVVAYAGIGSHRIAELGSKRGQEGRLDFDQVIAVGERATFVCGRACAEQGLVHADAIRVRFGRRFRLRSREKYIWVIKRYDSYGLLLPNERLEFLRSQACNLGAWIIDAGDFEGCTADSWADKIGD